MGLSDHLCWFGAWMNWKISLANRASSGAIKPFGFKAGAAGVAPAAGGAAGGGVGAGSFASFITWIKVATAERFSDELKNRAAPPPMITTRTIEPILLSLPRCC